MRWRLGLVLGLVLWAWLGPAQAVADPAAMPSSEVEALQRRLTDAGCYRGPIKALIEGLGGQADLLHKGTVTTATLDPLLENRVKELADGRQHPVMTRPKTVPDSPVAAVH